MGSIKFFSEKTRFKLPDPAKTTRWIKKVIKQEGSSLETINYIFCSDNYLLEINKQYLNHKTFTDIITFNYSQNPKLLQADIYISIDRVKDNAKAFGVSTSSELHRVIIHGVLHLLGFNDKSKAEKLKMREKEDSCLSLLKL